MPSPLSRSAVGKTLPSRANFVGGLAGVGRAVGKVVLEVATLLHDEPPVGLSRQLREPRFFVVDAEALTGYTDLPNVVFSLLPAAVATATIVSRAPTMATSVRTRRMPASRVVPLEVVERLKAP